MSLLAAVRKHLKTTDNASQPFLRFLQALFTVWNRS
jgi:hypothetical protein